MIGTTWTRFSNLLDRSLLTIRVGLVLRTWLPTGEAKSTHQISPRVILNVADQSFGPFERFCLSALVGRHLAVTSLEIGVQDVRPGKILQFDTYTTTMRKVQLPAHGGAQRSVNGGAILSHPGDREARFSIHGKPWTFHAGGGGQAHARPG